MDPYEVLGVRRNASSSEITLAYKGRRTQYHPDKYQGSDADTLAWATARMQEVNAAYELLSDAARRARFDAEGGQQGPSSAGASAEEGAHADLAASLASQLGTRWGFTRIYCAPDIPLKKLSAALSNYGQDLSPDDVVVLIDNTVFGGGKEGVLLTTQELRAKELAAPGVCIRWRDMRSVQAEGKHVFVDGRKVIECHMTEQHELQRLIAAVQGFVATLGGPRTVRAQPQSQARESGRAARDYRGRFEQAKVLLLEVCECALVMDVVEGDEGYIDRDNAALHFGELARCLDDPRKADRAWDELTLVGALSRQLLTLGNERDPDAINLALVQDRRSDSQLVSELRVLLRMVVEGLRLTQQRAQTDAFFGGR